MPPRRQSCCGLQGLVCLCASSVAVEIERRLVFGHIFKCVNVVNVLKHPEHCFVN